MKACSKWSLKQSSAWFCTEMPSQERCLSFTMYVYPYLNSMQVYNHILDLSALSALLHHFYFLDNRDLAQLSGQISNSDPSLLTLPQTGSVVTAGVPQGEFSL